MQTEEILQPLRLRKKRKTEWEFFPCSSLTYSALALTNAVSGCGRILTTAALEKEEEGREGVEARQLTAELIWSEIYFGRLP